MKTSIFHYLIFFFATLTLLVTSSNAQQIRIETDFNPPIVQAGQRTSYNLTIRGSQNAQIQGTLPTVPGLQISNRPSQSTGFEIINGHQSVRVTYSFGAAANSPGEYTIPAWTASIDGKKYNVPATTLKVIKPGEEFKDALFFELSRPEKEPYVGQRFDTVIKLYVLAGFDLQGVGDIQRIGDSFKQTAIGQAEQSKERRNGKPYLVLTWPLTLTPLKYGEQKLAYKLDIQVVSPTTSPRRRRSFFDFGHRQGEIRTVITDETPFTILPFPQKGKPADFTGAIGAFSMNPTISNTAVAIGETITLNLNITGSGNFDRISPPTIPKAEGLRIYKPKRENITDEESNDVLSVNFEYSIIPQSNQIRQIPPATFSFFNPEKKQYETLSTKPFPILVEGATPLPLPAPVSNTGSPIPTGTDIFQQPNANGTPRYSILPIKVASGNWVSTMQPILKNKSFLFGQFLPLAALLGIIFIKKHRDRLNTDGAFARKVKANKSVKKWMQKARDAASQNNANEFFEAAQRAIQEGVGHHLANVPETLTFSEIERVLKEHNASTETIKTTQLFCEAVDSIKFSSTTSNGQDLSEHRTSLEKLVSELNSLK